MGLKSQERIHSFLCNNFSPCWYADTRFSRCSFLNIASVRPLLGNPNYPDLMAYQVFPKLPPNWPSFPQSLPPSFPSSSLLAILFLSFLLYFNINLNNSSQLKVFSDLPVAWDSGLDRKSGTDYPLTVSYTLPLPLSTLQPYESSWIPQHSKLYPTQVGLFHMLLLHRGTFPPSLCLAHKFPNFLDPGVFYIFLTH